MKNQCGKTVDPKNAYEVWRAGAWEWRVLKKWQADDNKPFARWFCLVKSPFVPNGEYGDCYVADVKSHAVRDFSHAVEQYDLKKEVVSSGNDNG